MQRSLFDAILSYDPDTGILRWKQRADRSKQWNARFAGQPAGTVLPQGHIHIRVEGKNYYAHQIAWLLMTDTWPTQQIDHRDRVHSNNRWNNLRLATHAQNMVNRPSTNPYGPGITAGKSGKFYVSVGGKYLGKFQTLCEARVAAKAERRRLYGEFAE